MKFDDFSWILVLEAVLPFVILSIILIFTITSGRKKFKLAARKLILSVKTNEPDEKKAIYQFLTSNLSLDKKLAKKQVKKLMNERKFLIRNLVSGLLDKNIEAISQLNDDLCRVSAAYHQLKPVVTEQAAPPEEVVEEVSDTDQTEVNDLKKEIKSLKQEVHITLTTLNNIFKEFSSMFGEDDVPKEQMSVDQIITAMESFAGASSEPVAVAEEENQEDTTADATEEPNTQETTAEEAEESDTQEATAEEAEKADETLEAAPEETLDAQLEQSLKDMGVDDTALGEDVPNDDLDNALDDIDSALDELELDASDDEPDWGDAFAESGDVMESDEKK